jgi:protein-disulfide isomerase
MRLLHGLFRHGVTFLGTLVALWCVVAIFRAWSGPAPERNANPDSPDYVKWFESQPRIAEAPKGGPSAVAVVLFRDFQCPACRTFVDTMGEVLQRLGTEANRVDFSVKEFPLDVDCNPTVQRTVHPLACRAAAAHFLAAPAHRQGLADWLYRNQESLSEESVRWAATHLGRIANPDADYAKAQPALRQQAELGSRWGVKAVPTVFVNGVIIEGSIRSEALLAILRHELARVR